MPSVTTEQKVEVKISPALKRRLMLKLRTYAELKANQHVIEQGLAGLRDEIEGLFVDAGEFSALQAGVKVDKFKLVHVSPVRKKLDPMRLIAQGVTTAQIEEATVTVPTRGFVKVTCPGEKDE